MCKSVRNGSCAAAWFPGSRPQNCVTAPIRPRCAHAPPDWLAPPDWPGPSGPATSGEIVAGAIQLAVAFLTAGLDSPELEAWAAAAFTPHDADGLGNFMAGLHVVSELLLRELHEVTGQPPEAALQKLAIMAEHRRGTPFAD